MDSPLGVSSPHALERTMSLPSKSSYSAVAPTHLHQPLWRQATITALALSAALMAACGGGGSDSTTTSNATDTSTASSQERATAYAAGPITGFGSIIVNGVRYDDSGAVVTDDSGQVISRSLLKLGMVVSIDGTNVSSTQGVGRALRIRMGSEIKGPVTAVNATAGTLSVLGQAVTLTSTTVFDDSLSGGLAGIQVGSIVEVHAQYNATNGSYTAIRVEDESGATSYKLRGAIANLDTTAKTFSIGGQVINYASLSSTAVPSSLANGQIVRVLLQTTQINNQWVATAVSNGLNRPGDGLGAHLRGAITAFTSATAFEINGIVVDARNASFPDGQTGLALGTVVEVEGATSNGVVVATKVELDDRHASDRHRIKLFGTISELNTVDKTFKLRGVTVNYSGSTLEWKDGVEADLANGKSLEVRGTPSASRTQLMATRIDFD
jgi:Domain of unknown function (DUF5666)